MLCWFTNLLLCIVAMISKCAFREQGDVVYFCGRTEGTQASEDDD